LKQAFIDAKRAKVEQLELLARETLAANPFDELTSETVEGEWRELAHAMRQLGPLLEALEKAELAHPDFVKYRDGFDFRLMEAMTTIGNICSHGRIYRLSQQKNRTGKTSPRPQDALDEMMEDAIAQGLGASQAWDWINQKINNGSADPALDIAGKKIVVDRPEADVPKAPGKRRRKIPKGPRAISKESFCSIFSKKKTGGLTESGSD
jgi:hypothetical protein